MAGFENGTPFSDQKRNGSDQIKSNEHFLLENVQYMNLSTTQKVVTTVGAIIRVAAKIRVAAFLTAVLEYLKPKYSFFLFVWLTSGCF